MLSWNIATWARFAGGVSSPTPRGLPWVVALVLLWPSVLPAAGQANERGGLLPLQDRLGDPVLNVAVQETLRETLSSRHVLVDPLRLRDALRRLRLRNATQASPATLQQLAEEVSVDWLFTATLHTATESELTRAAQAFVGPGSVPVPQIILSAQVYRASAPGAEASMEWVGFASASGLDERSLLNLGIIEDPEILARRTAEGLVAMFEERPSVGAPEPDRGGFLRRAVSAERLGSVAVVPFEGVSDREANVAAEAVTSLALSVLDENRVRLVAPGIVNQILRRRGVLLRGKVDSATLAALHEAGADTVITGTVEGWEVRGGGLEPEPRVSFGARLIDAGSGQILWMNGQDRGGWDGLNLFGTGRTHSRGRLAEHMMRSLLAGFLEAGR